jgi:undecaprenyl-diphosphatase
MLLWQALILGLIQGVGELFPVSSLAQTILLPAVLGWQIDQQGSDFLAFVVALHLATAIALVIYFWQDWRKVLLALIGSAGRGKLVYDSASKLAWLLAAGTIVVGVVGAAFEKRFRHFFDDPRYYWVVAVILILNGVLMLLGDYLKHRSSRREGSDSTDPSSMAAPQRKDVEEMSFPQGAAVGAAQTLALFPGISRSGVTIVAGLLAGLSYEAASRFSFMLATPVIGLAALLKVPALLKPEARHQLELAGPAALVAGVTAYLSVAFLMRYFKHHRLSPFGYYCIVSGAAALFLLRH